jgi:MerR family transcriptional regulator, heat shock protein HspR
MTTELGMNLAGVERVLELEDKLTRLQRKVETMERRSEALQEEIAAREAEIARLEQVRESVRAEIVRYEAPGTALIPIRRVKRR